MSLEMERKAKRCSISLKKSKYSVLLVFRFVSFKKCAAIYDESAASIRLRASIQKLRSRSFSLAQKARNSLSNLKPVSSPEAGFLHRLLSMEFQAQRKPKRIC